jgi:hypothetical protein
LNRHGLNDGSRLIEKKRTGQLFPKQTNGTYSWTANS